MTPGLGEASPHIQRYPTLQTVDENDKRALARSVCFGDAVIAIAITLLVIDIAGYALYDGTMVAAAFLSAATWTYASCDDRSIVAGLDQAIRLRSLTGPLQGAIS